MQIDVKGSHSNSFKIYKPRENELPISVSYRWRINNEYILYKTSLERFRAFNNNKKFL